MSRAHGPHFLLDGRGQEVRVYGEHSTVADCRRWFDLLTDVEDWLLAGKAAEAFQAVRSGLDDLMRYLPLNPGAPLRHPLTVEQHQQSHPLLRARDRVTAQGRRRGERR
jgi:hypothetical protein